MALFIYGFKRKYERFRKSIFVKFCVYNLLRSFSTLKLSWYTVTKSLMGKSLTNKAYMKLDEQKFDEMIVSFIGETLTE